MALVHHETGKLAPVLVSGASALAICWAMAWMGRGRPSESIQIATRENSLIEAELAEWKERGANAESLAADLRERMEELEEGQSDQEALIAEQSSRLEFFAARATQSEAQAQEALKKEKAARTDWSQAQEERSNLTGRLAEMSDELTGQVVVSLSEAEQAITSAIEAFTRIAMEAQSATEMAHNMMGADSESSVARIATQATEVMEGFIHGMLKSARQIAESSRQLEKLIAVSEGLTELLDDVQAVADQTDMISLNALIEAARSGAQGRTFGVVANEVRKLADRSRATADRMRGITGDLMRETKMIYTTLGLTAESSLEASCEAQNEVNRLLGQLCQADANTQNTLTQLSVKSGNIMENYTSIITAFQFHDLLRQRLEHVAEPLVRLGNSLRGEAPESDESEKLAYAVGDRSFQARALGAAPSLEVVSYALSDDDNITLF